MHKQQNWKELLAWLLIQYCRFFLSLLALCCSLMASLFLFFWSSLPKLWCCICFSLIYFHSKTASGCQPTITLCEGDKCYLLCTMLLLPFLGEVKQWVYSTSIFSRPFGQRCLLLKFLSKSCFGKLAQPLIHNWNLNTMITSAFWFRYLPT